ncbi:hypothetical protein G9P44_005956 [Scheffersomyces stipitis]|nr:hypothetical protein G9P44_005956 [Scheffersomyces stipitis]
MSSEENQFNLQGYNIITILKRLEAATSRLEDISIFQTEAQKNAGERAISSGSNNSTASGPIGAISGPKAPVAPSSAGESAAAVAKPKSVVAFEAFIKSSIGPLVEKSNQIDPLVGEAASLLQAAFSEQTRFLEIVAKAKKPDLSNSNFVQVLTPINKKVSEIIGLKDTNRRSEYFNHLNTIAEGASVVGWIVTDTPVSAVPEFKDSAKFWSDRVLKEFKEKDQKHVQWVQSFLAIFDDLKTYIKEFHTTGPAWNNASGVSFEEALESVDSSSSSAAAPGAAGGAPPPPPPPPPPPASLFDDSKPKEAPAGGINAVFAELNQGENITSGLKKVDKSEMTHKNPALRAQAPAVAKKPAPPKKPSSLSSSAAVAPKKKPAQKELIDGTKWIIQNYTAADVADGSPIVIDVEMHQSVFIGNCDGITIQLKGKANAVSISETKNTGIVVDSLISGVDIIKSYKFGLQIVGVVAIISIDKSDEGSVYLSKESVEADAQVFTSSTTALNINVPTADDYEELAVPEQFKHTIKNGKLQSDVVEHVG